MVDTFTDVHVKSWIYKLQHDLLRIFRLMLIFLNSEMYMYGHLNRNTEFLRHLLVKKLEIKYLFEWGGFEVCVYTMSVVVPTG